MLEHVVVAWTAYRKINGRSSDLWQNDSRLVIETTSEKGKKRHVIFQGISQSSIMGP